MVPDCGEVAVTRRPRRTVTRGSQPRTETPAPAGPPPAPPAFLGSWQWRQPDPQESTSDWLDRTERQRAQIIAEAGTWLQVGQAVRVNRDPGAGGGDVAGRTGTVHRLCGPVFADYTQVSFPPRGREKVSRLRMLPLEILEPVE